MKKLKLTAVIAALSALFAGVAGAETVIPGLPGSDRFFPDLLITEIAANPSKGNSRGEGYEFVEIYNNTDHGVNLEDYQIIVSGEDGKTSDWDISAAHRLRPGGTAAVWLKNGDSHRQGAELNPSDFNDHYHTILKNGQLAEAESTGLSNISGRTISIRSHAGHTIISASYTAGKKSAVTPDGFSLQYEYPRDGTNAVKLRGTVKVPSPGMTSKGQVPQAQNRIVDRMSPEIIPVMPVFDIPARRDLPISFRVRDDRRIMRATLFYKRAQDKIFSKKYLTSKKNQFSGKISRFDLYAATPAFQYYLEVTDGIRAARYPKAGFISVRVGNPNAYLPFKKGLSITNESVLNGRKHIEVHKDSPKDSVLLYQNGHKLKTIQSLSRQPIFVYEANGIKEGYKGGLFQGSHLVKILEQTHGKFGSFEAAIPQEKIRPGDNRLTIKTGSRQWSFGRGKRAENLNGFEMKNVRLLLGDGTILKPYAVLTETEKGKTSKSGYKDGRVYYFGNSSRHSVRAPLRHFIFRVPKDKFLTERTVIDTKKESEGRHHFRAVINGDVIEASPKFDHSPPEIAVKELQEGGTYKGTFTIDAKASDRISRWSSLKADLDGRKIKLPYTTSSGALSKGKHKVIFTASDAAGNVSIKVFHFHVVNEDPIIRETAFPPPDSSGLPLSTSLSVKVNDPTKDHMKAIFYSGQRYDYAAESGIKGFTCIADREPPPALEQEGEKDIGQSPAGRLAKSDGTYLVTETQSGFPYQRFEVPIKEKAKQVRKIEIEWRGHSYAGRRVTMYAWNYRKFKWEELAYGYGAEDFTLKARVGRQYVKNQKVNVLIQDLTDHVHQNFSMIWMSDTQYYASAFPYIFPIMTNWAKAQFDQGNAGYVIHTGDIIDFRWDQDQWKTASKSLAALDHGGVPYGVLPGNHDSGSLLVDYKNYSAYFGKNRFSGQPTYGGGPESNAYHYDLVSFGGHDFIVLYLGWGKETSRDAVKWANAVLQKHSDRNAILAVHSYLQPNGKRTIKGRALFNRIVKPNENVKLVLSGHYFGASRHIEEIRTADGGVRRVVEMLADYQGGPEGGQGYMRLLQFDPANRLLRVKTYSPYLDHYNFFDSDTDEFTLAFDLNDIHKQVATDYISASVFTKEKLGEDLAVKNGHARIRLSGLKPYHDYCWYMEVSDKYGGKTLSPLWKFTSGSGE
ncbi:lamin tail domain-containing protein [Peribacillus sp. SCS-37]|uniref:lamin tail domain-containing protein n=1 Tax=Paraperibacillus esterisolvens TaxID=3115296 RepID=UPI003906428E